jgi:hypothetical protein
MRYREDALAMEAVVARRRPAGRSSAALGVLPILSLLAGCATPIEVVRLDPHKVEHQLDSNVISTGRLSEFTRVVLHRENLSGYFQSNPDSAIPSLRHTRLTGKPDPDALFAFAEMSF